MKNAELEANVVVYNSALDACSRAGKPKVAKQLMDMMKDSGQKRDVEGCRLVVCSMISFLHLLPSSFFGRGG